MQSLPQQRVFTLGKTRLLLWFGIAISCTIISIVGFNIWQLNLRGYCFSAKRYVSDEEILKIAANHAFKAFISPRTLQATYVIKYPYKDSDDLLRRNPRCCEVMTVWGGEAYNRTELKARFSMWARLFEAGKIRWVFMQFDNPAIDPSLQPRPREHFLITAHDNCGKMFDDWTGRRKIENNNDGRSIM
jgi:hypothetical protein